MLQGLANAWWKTLDESGTRALCAIVSTTINKQSNSYPRSSRQFFYPHDCRSGHFDTKNPCGRSCR